MNETEYMQQHEVDLQRLRGFRLLDDDFMAKVFEDKACVELLLRIILQKNDLYVKEVHGQLSLKNLQGRSARLDVFAADSTGKVYDIEVQRSDKGASFKRARYNAALIDANITEPGDEYEALNECFVIFITENDVIGDGLPIYHAERTILETGKPFGDEQHILCVNAQITDETELGRLMHDMWCVEANDMHYSVLADRVRYFTENDVIGDGLPIYHVERTILETGKPFGDEQHILYVNAQITDETELGRLMHDMWCVEADDMHYSILADRVRYFKENEEGVTIMCRAMEEMRNETALQATFKAKVEDLRTIMETLKISVQEALKVLRIPDSEHERYIAAIES